MKRKSTKIALLTSILCVVLCGALILGGTFAWFSDEVKAENNIIKSGNLDIELDYYNGADWQDVEADTNLFSSTSWEPGHTEVVYLKLTNAGSLDLAYTLGINIVEEIKSKTASGAELVLSDHIQYGVVVDKKPSFTSSAAAVSAAEYPSKLSTGYARSRTMAAATATTPAETYLALVVFMPGSVGNEANYATGATVPTIKLGVTLTATQKAAAEKNINDQLAQGGTGTGTVPYGTKEIPVYATGADQTDANKIATFNIDSDSVVDNNAAIDIKITPTDELATGITVRDDQEAASFEIDVTNLDPQNTVPVKVELNIGDGLSGVTLYHKGNLIASNYNAESGYVTFKTLDFSPFTVLFDDIYQEPVVDTQQGLPEANVVRSSQFENTALAWGNYGEWSPTAGLDAELEAAYTFSVAQTTDELAVSPYKDWYCDFYVSLDKDLGANQIFLGGNYGSFGWIGFHNGDLTLDAGTEIPLLGSVTSNPWTYEAVAQNVGTFICGVGDVNDALEGATFTVKLRLTNPKNEAEFYDVATINYTFTGTGTEAPSGLPTAVVTRSSEYEDKELAWGDYGTWAPTEGLEAKLDAAYTFTCEETAEEAAKNPYANWYCDFYVKLDRDLGENEIFLGGNYGSFGWVGFHNGDVTLEANEEIPLLGSVTKNPWTYEDVAAFVGEFICGVGDVNGSLSDATFTVMLRLTNPENTNEFYNVATIEYKFPTVVTNGQELQDAINNGSENIQLGGDIDLSNGIVIP